MWLELLGQLTRHDQSLHWEDIKFLSHYVNNSFGTIIDIFPCWFTFFCCTCKTRIQLVCRYCKFLPLVIHLRIVCSYRNFTEDNTRIFETLRLLNLEQNNSRLNNLFDVKHPFKCGHALIYLVRVSNLVAGYLRKNFRLRKEQEVKQRENKYFL